MITLVLASRSRQMVLSLMIKALLLLLLFAPVIANSKSPNCAEQAQSTAKKLLAFHAGLESPDASSVSIVKNYYLGNKSSRTKDGTTLETFEIGFLVDPAGYYDIDLSFMVLKGACNLVGQRIQEAWVDGRYPDPPRAKQLSR